MPKCFTSVTRVLICLALAAPAMAQRTTGEIIGKVIDESGAVLPGVTVTLRGAGVAGTPTTVTTETGGYRFQSCHQASTKSSTPSRGSPA